MRGPCARDAPTARGRVRSTAADARSEAGTPHCVSRETLGVRLSRVGQCSRGSVRSAGLRPSARDLRPVVSECAIFPSLLGDAGG